MVDRVHRELSDDDVAKIAETYHAWRGDKNAKTYADVPGFCKAANLDEIRQYSYVLTRYTHHNPLVTSGRAGVVKFFGSRPKSATCDKLNAPVVAVLADGNLVTVDRVGSQGLEGADIYNNVLRHVADLGW